MMAINFMMDLDDSHSKESCNKLWIFVMWIFVLKRRHEKSRSVVLFLDDDGYVSHFDFWTTRQRAHSCSTIKKWQVLDTDVVPKYSFDNLQFAFLVNLSFHHPSCYETS